MKSLPEPPIITLASVLANVAELGGDYVIVIAITLSFQVLGMANEAI